MALGIPFARRAVRPTHVDVVAICKVEVRQFFAALKHNVMDIRRTERIVEVIPFLTFD
jgi:hypothetical protein